MNELFVINRNNCSCAGGTASLDLFFAFVAARFGKNNVDKTGLDKIVMTVEI